MVDVGAFGGEQTLAVRSLRVSFDLRGTLLPAVSDLSFLVPAGRTLGIVGESGSGKTVVARAVMGLLPRTARTSGSVTFGGTELLGLADSQRRLVYGRRVAMVFQDPSTALNPVRTIGAQLAESLRFHLGLDRHAARERSVELLERVEVPDARRRIRQYPNELSGGTRQRVVIAMAISCGPRLLICDEPTTALDVTVQRTILDLLQRLCTEQQTSMILITHDLSIARGRCDDVLVLYAGQAAEYGPARAVLAQPIHPYTSALLDAVPRLGSARGEPLRPIPGRVPDLDDRPGGCAFAPRCRFAGPECGTAPRAGGTDGHRWWCHHPAGAPLTSGVA